MVVAFDNTVLSLLLHPEADAPFDPATGAQIARAQDRMAYLVEQLREEGSRILIPTPVLAEFLTFASPDYLAVINQSVSRSHPSISVPLSRQPPFRRKPTRRPRERSRG